MTDGYKIKKIYVGTNLVRPPYPTESIVYKMNADSGGNLYVPTGGYKTNSQVGAAYNWKVSVDYGAETAYSGTGSSGSKITLSGYTAGSSHIIMIRPNSENYGWARAYCWYSSGVGSLLTEILYDGSYMGYGDSATSTGGGFRRLQYESCSSLINVPEEVLPDTITTIGNYFRENQFRYCSLITYSPEEKLPNTVTSIGSGFRVAQYRFCTSLTEIKGWKDLSIGGNYYRQVQYGGATSNKTVKVLSDVGYASYAADTLPNDYVTSVSVPSAYLSNYTSSTKQPRTSIGDAKFIGY